MTDASSPDHARGHAHRHRRFLGRPADQFRTALVPTLGAAVLLIILLAFVHQMNANRVRSLSEANPGVADVLSFQASDMETSLTLGAVAYLFGILVIGLAHSRRLVGALFAVNRRLARMAEGDFEEGFRLRRGDYFQEIAGTVNGVARALKRQANEDLADLDDLVSVLDRSPHAGHLRDGLREGLAELREKKRRLAGGTTEIGPTGEPAARPRLVATGRG